MILRVFCLYSVFVIFKLESISADPLAKEVIRAMDKVISDHVEWDNWEAWSKIMEEVKNYCHLVRIINMYTISTSKISFFSFSLKI